MIRNCRTGFTLIELSIVLVIIGLVIGGVLIGQDLINAANIRAAGTQIEGYETAIGVFRSKYHAMPGDLTSEQAISLGMQPRGICEGGNGELNAGCGNCGIDYPIYRLSGEIALFWRDLSQSGLIAESFNSATDTCITNIIQSNLRRYLPESRLAGNYIHIGTWNYPGVASVLWPFGVSVSTFYMIRGLTAVGASGAMDVPLRMTALTAFRYDSKFDDGNPGAGSVQSADSTVNGPSAVFSEPPSATACRSTSSTYNATYTEYACRLLIRSRAWSN